MNELGEIESHIGEMYFNIIEKYNKTNTGLRIGGYHVSDFVSPCLRKSYYNITEPKPPFDEEKGRILWLGNIIHEHIALSEINELTMCYDIVEDVAIPPAIAANMTPEQRKNLITGSLDDLIKYNGEYIIGDKKTWQGRGWEKEKPNPEYVAQLNIYRVLLKESWNIDATSGCLLFMDKTENLRPQPMAFRLQDIDITKEFMRKTLKELQKEGGPEANPCWLCEGKNKTGKIYCDYWEKCNSETDRQEKLNLSKKLQDYSDQQKREKIINDIKSTKTLEDFSSV